MAGGPTLQKSVLRPAQAAVVHRIYSGRVNINEGSWLLEPVGNQTKATYTIYTDGGGLPPLIVDAATKQSVLRLFEALRVRLQARNVQPSVQVAKLAPALPTD
jgi:hypothetical protein